MHNYSKLICLISYTTDVRQATVGIKKRFLIPPSSRVSFLQRLKMDEMLHDVEKWTNKKISSFAIISVMHLFLLSSSVISFDSKLLTRIVSDATAMTGTAHLSAATCNELTISIR